MRTTSSILIVFAMLVGGASSSSSSPTRPMPFCPDCWKFLDQPGDLDGAGRCIASGKKPVEVEAVSVPWYWCRPHNSWHRRPCGKGYSHPSTSPALLLPSGSESVSLQAFCPGEGMFSDLGHEGLACPVCSRPLAAVEAVERQWFWCGTQKKWLMRPCSANRNLLVCCKSRKGLVPVLSWQVPLPGEISSEGAAREEMRVDTEWLAAHLNDPHLVVIHVGFDLTDPALSTRPTYFDGHIPGARSMAWSEIAVTRNGIPNEFPPAEQLVQMVRSLGLDVHDRIVLYDTGFGIEAARAYLTLDYLGLADNAALLDGQWARWKALKLPETRMFEDVEPSGFVPKLRPEILVSQQAMKDLAWLAQQESNQVALLDARAAEEYAGYRAGKAILRGGHIPGATNLCWNLALEPVNEPILRAEPELRGLFEAVGARPGDLVVTYCRTGTEASLLYFAAKYLGYEARFYDGSYFEWSRREELPIQGNWAKP